MTKVFIDGSAGTTGLRIYDRLKNRSDIELLILSDDKRKDEKYIKEYINMSDISFLCLPDAAAKEAVLMCENENTAIIDTSTAHRTDPSFTYGLPEIKGQLEKIRKSKRIANPGCHATGFITLIRPLTDAGVLDKDILLSCTSVTGYSGGGKKMIAEYESEEKGEELFSPRQYGLAQNHKHLPEMKEICELSELPIFAPIVDDFYSGMVVSVPLFSKLLVGNPTAKQIHEIFENHYKNEKVVKVMPFGKEGFLGSNNLSGKDGLQIEVTGNDERILIASRFDNLGKGSSGAAIQCMNLALGFGETLGLDL